MSAAIYCKPYTDDIAAGAGFIESIGVDKELDGASVLITGATGLIGSAVVEVLLFLNEHKKAKITVYAAGRSEDKVKARFGEYFDGEYLKFVKYDACDPASADGLPPVDYIIHGAGNAYPAAFNNAPVETMASGFLGTKALLEHISKVENTVKGGAGDVCRPRLLYISSSEVYGKKDNMAPFSEDDYGYVDILNPRSAYPMAKRTAEALCAAFAKEHGTEHIIVRPGHIYGPTASKEDDRVSSQFAYKAACGEDLVLKSDGSQLRSYTYVIDCATAILTALIKGKPQEAYNISNPSSIMSIKEISELFAKAGGVSLSFAADVTVEEKSGFNPMQNSSLDSSKLEALGWRGLFDKKMGTEHTVQTLKNRQNLR